MSTPEQPKGTMSDLTYKVNGPRLDLMHLRDLVEKWQELVASGMPGAEIVALHYDQTACRITVSLR